MSSPYTKAALLKAKIRPTWTDGATISFIGSDGTLLASLDPDSSEKEVTGTLQFVNIKGSTKNINGTFAFANTLKDASGVLLPVNSVEINRYLGNINMIIFSGDSGTVSSALTQVEQVKKPRWDMTSGHEWERKVVFAGHLLHASLVSGQRMYSSLLLTDDIVDRAKKSAKQLSKKTADQLQQQLDNGNTQITNDAQANGKQVEDIQGKPSDQWELLVNDSNEQLKLSLITDADNMRDNTIKYIRNLPSGERDNAANVAVAGFGYINKGTHVIFDNALTVAQGIIGRVIDAWKQASEFIENVTSIASDVVGLISSLF